MLDSFFFKETRLILEKAAHITRDHRKLVKLDNISGRLTKTLYGIHFSISPGRNHLYILKIYLLKTIFHICPFFKKKYIYIKYYI